MPLTVAQIEDIFGKLEWHDDPDRRGAIVISPEWQAHHLTRIEPPFPLRDGSGKPVKLIACHRLIADALQSVLTLLRDNALDHLINSFDGCWCPRHKVWDPARGISSHSWGIAVDINARSFPYGSHHKQDARLVAAFARHGFEAGQNWGAPDPMHFECIGLPASAAPAPPLAPAASVVKIIINDHHICDGRIEDGHTIAPIRPIVEALGATITYDPDRGEVHIHRRSDP